MVVALCNICEIYSDLSINFLVPVADALDIQCFCTKTNQPPTISFLFQNRPAVLWYWFSSLNSIIKWGVGLEQDDFGDCIEVDTNFNRQSL